MQQAGPGTAQSPLTLVQRAQFRIQRAQQRDTSIRGHLTLFVDRHQRIVPVDLRGRQVALQRVDECQFLGLLADKLLAALHDLQLLLFEAALPALQRLQFVLQFGDLLGPYRATVHQLLVARFTPTHSVDLGLELRDLLIEITHCDGQRGQPIIGITVLSLDRVEPLLLGKILLAMRQTGQRGVEFGHVTLHVGAGTFQPMRADDVRDHRMHGEWLNVGAELVAQIRRTRERGGRVVAVGTTVVRALERARAVGADRAAARVLGLAPGTPVMRLRRTALTFGDKPVEWRVSTVQTAGHDYVQTLSRPA